MTRRGKYPWGKSFPPASPDGKENEMKRYTATVSGRAPFPLDMLRYDTAWPADPWSVTVLGLMHKDVDPERVFSLHIASHHSFTPGRWASFGWTLVEGE